MSAYFFKINPAGSYLLDAAEDTPNDPSTVILTDLRINPGDTIRIIQTGTYQAGDSEVFSDVGTGILAVFVDKEGNYLKPLSYRPKNTPLQASGKNTNIAEDFGIDNLLGATISVPADAVAVKFSVQDIYFGDNEDPNQDLGAMIVTGDDALLSGREVIQWFDQERYQASDEDEDQKFLFHEYIDISAAGIEDWSSAAALSAKTINYSSTSSEGSSLTLGDTFVESLGQYSADFNLKFLSSVGDDLSWSAIQSGSYSSAKSSERLKVTVNWKYIGDKTSQDDDLAIKEITDRSYAENYSANGSQIKFVEKNDLYYESSGDEAKLLKVKYTLTSNESFDQYWGLTATQSQLSVTQFQYADAASDFKLSFVGSVLFNSDVLSDVVNVNLSKISLEKDGIKVSTVTFKGLAPKGDGPFDLDISVLETLTGTLSEGIAALVMQGNNVVTTINHDGVNIDGDLGKDSISGGAGDDFIDGGAGDDKVNGGTGNDILTGGGGIDFLTGGKGNDIFILDFDVFDFTSAKALKITTVTDFKFTSVEQDELVLDGFGGEFAFYKTLAEAKKASETANVIYEANTGKFWYNDDGDSNLIGLLNFAVVRGISDTYWTGA